MDNKQTKKLKGEILYKGFYHLGPHLGTSSL